MKALIGYTGFVGSNLLRQGRFDALYNSKNVEDAFGTKPGVMYFCGIGAEKFRANADPAGDCAAIQNAMRNMERIAPRAVVLISTVDVYKNPCGVDETTAVDEDGLHPYGLHRRRLEQFVAGTFPDHLIVRLPGLYGDNLKKNFLFDMIRLIPSMLTEQKMGELDQNYLSGFYLPSRDGFYRLRELTAKETADLRGYFRNAGFSALSFTDSRAVFQFYNLSRLAPQIEQARDAGIRLLNAAVEPAGAAEIYRAVMGGEFFNERPGTPPVYDMRSVHSAVFGGENGYFWDKKYLLEDLKKFVREEMKKI